MAAYHKLITAAMLMTCASVSLFAQKMEPDTTLMFAERDTKELGFPFRSHRVSRDFKLRFDILRTVLLTGTHKRH